MTQQHSQPRSDVPSGFYSPGDSQHSGGAGWYSGEGWLDPSVVPATASIAARPGQRFFAWIVDALSSTFVCLVISIVDPNLGVIVGWTLFITNTILLQGLTGKSFGRILTNTELVAVGTHDRPGIPTTAIRCLIFGVLYVVTVSMILYVNAFFVVSRTQKPNVWKSQTLVDVWCKVEVIRLP